MKKMRPWLGWLVALGATAFAFRGCVLPDPKPPMPPISLPPVVKVVAGEAVEIVAETKHAELEWEWIGDPKTKPPQLLRTGDAKSRWFVSPPGVSQGQYRIRVMAWDGKFLRAETLVTVGQAPVPPDPGPDPPDPGPTPGPAPIPAEGLHVLVVYEAQDAKDPVKQKQYNALCSAEVLGYLNAKNRGGWRIWDKDVNVANEQKLWQDAFKRAKEKMNMMPWIIVSNGKAGWEGQLPNTKEEMLTLLKKYGEVK